MQCFGKRNQRVTRGQPILPYFYLSVPITLKKSRMEKWNAASVFILKHETTERNITMLSCYLISESIGISVTCAAL